ncbi:MAG TPA: hypothetical protein VK737_03470 [Opitutales bacterium]|nr:hypothetical protein [Opitutales bacterium]
MNVYTPTVFVLIAACVLTAPVYGQPVAAPNDQPTAFQTEALPGNASAAATGRGGAARGGGGVQANFVATLTDDQLAQLHAKLDELNAAIKALKDAKADDDLVVDAEACGWIVETTLRIPNAYGDSDSLVSPFNKCLSLLNAGLRRAQEIKDGTATWPQNKGKVDRAYRSVVDGTAQPYHVTIPASYDPAKPMPLYIYLHGMSHYVPDMGWDWAGTADRANAGGNGNYIRVEMFGRGNNSFRWAGETDVLEALASVRKRYNIDPDRILLAGFSMGGAGSWQIGLHNPDMFCGLEIDAGVIGNRMTMDGLTPAQKAATATYGIMIPHAVNVLDVPLVGYAGANDAQLASSKSIRTQLEKEGYNFNYVSDVYSLGKDIDALFLANPGQAHSHATGATLQAINEFSDLNFTHGRVIPDRIRFVTYTTRYNQDYWITVDGMTQQFDQARVEATRDAAKANYTVTTNNVSRLLLSDMTAAKKISMDGATIDFKSAANVLLVRNAAGLWQQADPAADTGLRKKHDLQGPVNDAFFDSFLCVTPTGTPYSAITDERGKEELARFSAAFTKDYCGNVRTKDDTAITLEDIANNNLVLFGDPGSNKILVQIADKLPIKWSKDSIVVGGKTYSPADHVPVLIYPNPLNPQRYVVINTGLVTGGGGGGGMNAGYGDFAILQVSHGDNGKLSDQVVQDGVFDAAWQLPSQP